MLYFQGLLRKGLDLIQYNIHMLICTLKELLVTVMHPPIHTGCSVVPCDSTVRDRRQNTHHKNAFLN